MHSASISNHKSPFRRRAIIHRRLRLRSTTSASIESRLELEGVHFKGYVPAAELPALYVAHDIFVNASNADNFPAALVEAACSGLPIVTTAAGGIPDMIRDRENGLLIGLNDHQALAAAFIELVEEPELARRLAWSARAWVEQFSWPGPSAACCNSTASPVPWHPHFPIAPILFWLLPPCRRPNQKSSRNHY
jgi:glycosyltransferase involved in cell wall biosynthesis